MKRVYHIGDVVNYRGYEFRILRYCIEVYDKYGNFLKRSTFRDRGSISEMKYYVDSLIKRNNLRWRKSVDAGNPHQWSQRLASCRLTTTCKVTEIQIPTLS